MIKESKMSGMATLYTCAMIEVSHTNKYIKIWLEGDIFIPTATRLVLNVLLAAEVERKGTDMLFLSICFFFCLESRLWDLLVAPRISRLLLEWFAYS